MSVQLDHDALRYISKSIRARGLKLGQLKVSRKFYVLSYCPSKHLTEKLPIVLKLG